MRRPAKLSVLLLPVTLLCVVCWAKPVVGQNVFQRLRERMREQMERTPGIPDLQPPPRLGRPEAVPGDAATSPATPSNALSLGVTAAEQGLRPPYRVVVLSVAPETTAERLGLRPGDVIAEIDGTSIQAMRDIAAILKGKQPGDLIVVQLIRERRPLQLTAIIPEQAANRGAERLDPLPAAGPGGASMQAPRKILEKTPPGSGQLGITVENAATTSPGAGVPVKRGAVVVGVRPDSPAAALGLDQGDVVVAIDGVLIADAAALVAFISQTQPGQQIELSYYQGEALKREFLTLAGPNASTTGSTASKVAPNTSAEEPSLPGNASGVFGAVGNAIGGLFGSGGEQNSDEGAPQTQPENNMEFPQGNVETQSNVEALPAPNLPAARGDDKTTGTTQREKVLLEELAILRAQVQALQQRIQQLESQLKDTPE